MILAAMAWVTIALKTPAGADRKSREVLREKEPEYGPALSFGE
jgi:hypothetical protein